ncbi:MAG: CpsD/CapB family tyrosine-protein kinase, partial [Blastocatellia bacterium]
PPSSSPTVAEDHAAQMKEAPTLPEKPLQRQREIPVEPIVQSRIHPRLILLTDPQTPECEQYRTLRTQLFHAAEKKPLQTVTITSTLAGEGKTSTVINLALAIAQSKEKRVLVIDGDLRRPNVAAYLGVRAKTGLGEVLSGEAELLDTIFTLEGYELYILPVSREVANPTELLSSERWAAMITELRRYFDFILVDSPPVMPFADVRLLANHTDAVMLVVRAGMATYDTVEKAIEALPGDKMLGVVLNGVEHIEEAGYYDYYYDSQRGQRRSVWNKLLHPLRKTSLGRKWKL